MTDDQALHGVAVSHRRTEPIWVSQSHIVIFCTSVLFLVHTGAKRLRGACFFLSWRFEEYIPYQAF